MADGAQSLFSLAESDTTLLELRKTAFQRYHGIALGATVTDELSEEVINNSALIALLLTQVNGDAVMSNQAVQIEYLHLWMPKLRADPDTCPSAFTYRIH